MTCDANIAAPLRPTGGEGLAGIVRRQSKDQELRQLSFAYRNALEAIAVEGKIRFAPCVFSKKINLHA